MTNTRTNARRGRPMVTLTLAPETVARIDKMIGRHLGLPGTRPLSRGEYIDMLVEQDVVNNAVCEAFERSGKPRRRRVRG